MGLSITKLVLLWYYLWADAIITQRLDYTLLKIRHIAFQSQSDGFWIFSSKFSVKIPIVWA